MVACKQTRRVSDGRYLIKKNKIIQTGDKFEKDDLAEIIKQQPNYKQFGVKWKLRAFNAFDSTKVANKRHLKNQKILLRNRVNLSRQDRVNSRRMDKAIQKGRTHYTQKIVSNKDTINPRKFFREWYKYKLGRSPVVYDSTLYNKSLEQLELFIRKKGYYNGEVTGFVDFKKNKKCVVHYHLVSGKRYFIDSVFLESDNELLLETYKEYLSKHENSKFENKPFDSDELDRQRRYVSKHMRNQGFYGFSSSHITYLADTSSKEKTVNLSIRFSDRYLKSTIYPDSIVQLRHEKAYISKVFFHVADTIYYEGSFKRKVDSLGLSMYVDQFFRTLDTTLYAQVLDKKTGEIDPARTAMFLHNGELRIKPRILEAQNYLEVDTLYSESYLEKTYLSLLRLELFQAVKTELVENEGTGCLDVHYYLIPSKKQSFGFEPRSTNSNGFLGVAATVNYTNRNLFKGAQKLTLSLSGGFESQPPIFDETLGGDKIKTAARSFNTFEFGPTVKLELPGLFPLKFTKFSKKLHPKTIISSAYNFQKRDDFTRSVFQLNYEFKFFSKKTMIFHMGIPLASVVKFVNIDKNTDFESKLTLLNDLFLLNAYSNQFVWQDAKFTFEYNIKEKETRKGNSQLYFSSHFDLAGNMLSILRSRQDTLSNGQKSVLGVGYSQFSRIDNELIFSKPIGKEKSFNFHANVGAGIPYGNTKTSMPYDYSFFAGGANDNRGWRARALGPGSYKYYLDETKTATQIGDLRIGSSGEFRFAFNSLFKGAIFVDAGNIWTIYEDPNRIGGQFTENWYKEIAIAGGFGLRMDLEYFIIRLDIGVPMRNPALPEGAQWIFQSRALYEAEGLATFGPDYKTKMPNPFVPAFHFGIGYPF
tara:strand:+ start:51 stop:2660 length:2610 start_codon:yes stop_codon:yes gene_type:complete